MSGAFSHDFLLCESEREFVAATAELVLAGLSVGESVVVALEQDKIDVLRTALGRDASRMHWVAEDGVGNDPARVDSTWQRFLETQMMGDRRVRGIEEPISSARAPAESSESQSHETLLNLAYMGRSFTLLCPCDTGATASAAIEGVLRLHEFVRRGGGETTRSNHADASDSFVGPVAETLRDPPAGVKWWGFGLGDLGAARDFVRTYAIMARATPRQADDFVVAANEVVANSIVHGGGSGTYALWREPDRMFFEVRDSGHRTPPLADRTAAIPCASSGRGLRLANHLCELIQIRSSSDGTAVRMHLRIPRRPDLFPDDTRILSAHGHFGSRESGARGIW